MCVWRGSDLSVSGGGGEIALYSGPYDPSLRDNWVIFQLIIIYHLEIDNRLAMFNYIYLICSFLF